MLRALNYKETDWFTPTAGGTVWGRGGVVVSALDFRSEGRWFDAQSLFDAHP